jgi:caffeoyl-CoA O-methyltransferase
MPNKYTNLDDALYTYMCQCRSQADDPVLKALQEETQRLGDISRMQISPEQGSFMGMLAAAIGARHIIEVGTFTGYSAICMARALPQDGKLLCLDASEEWTAIARRYWGRAGLKDRIELRLGPAVPSLQALEPSWRFDFAFIDAEKTEYDSYYELVLPRMRVGGLILFDNMLWGGQLGRGEIDQATGRAIDALNHKLAKDPRVQSVLISIGDGINICRVIEGT